MTLSLEAYIRVNDQVIARQVADEYILVPMFRSSEEIDCIFNLNQTGAAIWERLDGKKQIRVLVDELLELYDGDRAVIEQEVLTFLDELAEAGIVTVVDDEGN